MPINLGGFVFDIRERSPRALAIELWDEDPKVIVGGEGYKAQFGWDDHIGRGLRFLDVLLDGTERYGNGIELVPGLANFPFFVRKG